MYIFYSHVQHTYRAIDGWHACVITMKPIVCAFFGYREANRYDMRDVLPTSSDANNSIYRIYVPIRTHRRGLMYMVRIYVGDRFRLRVFFFFLHRSLRMFDQRKLASRDCFQFWRIKSLRLNFERTEGICWR